MAKTKKKPAKNAKDYLIQNHSSEQRASCGVHVLPAAYHPARFYVIGWEFEQPRSQMLGVRVHVLSCDVAYISSFAYILVNCRSIRTLNSPNPQLGADLAHSSHSHIIIFVSFRHLGSCVRCLFCCVPTTPDAFQVNKLHRLHHHHRPISKEKNVRRPDSTSCKYSSMVRFIISSFQTCDYDRVRV